MHKLVDDILVTGRTKKELLERALKVSKACLQNRITLSATKAQIGTCVKFAGFLVDSDGTRPDPEKIQL